MAYNLERQRSFSRLHGAVLIISVSVTLATTSPTILAGFKEGMEALGKEEYGTALREFKVAADKGDARAQYELGVMYANGRGTPRSDAEAAKWYRKAADQNFASAQVNLGVLYRQGRGVPQDYEKAFELFRPLAEQGNESAAVNLGVLYDNGWGVPEDPAEALKWYRAAAEKDHPTAEQAVGNDYWIGRGTAQDFSEARRWLQKAADQGHPSSQADLSLIYFRGDGVRPDYELSCLWSQLALLRLKDDEKRPKVEDVKNRSCAKLTAQQRRAIDKRVAEWKPNDVWGERNQRTLEERRKQWEAESAGK